MTVSLPVVAERLLAPHTTLRLGGPAARLVEAGSADVVVEAVRAADAAAERVLVLGGGSNVVIADEGVPGTVVRVTSRGHRVERADDGSVVLVAEAGEDWDELVAAAVAEGLGGGLECLSGIPGSTGATPVQNVGAYGVEVSDLLVDVDLYDRRTREVRRVPASALALGYRTSVLKHRDDAIVLRVRFRLRADGLSAPIRYAELARTLGVEAGATVPAAQARAAVLGLRRGKGMVLDAGDHDTWSVGSFFTNPVLPEEEAPAVDGLARWPAGPGRVKLSAAGLIERSGFHRGYPGPGGRVGLSTKHVLALTHRGGGTTADLLELAREIRSGVRERFGVDLVPEPVMIGCSV